jgi:hypothetical protein
MPAIYTSYAPDPTDDLETRRKKFYLAIISVEEQAYTLGAAIGECRKQLTAMDNLVRNLKKEFQAIR